MAAIGLLCGAGRLPVLVAKAATAQGHLVTGVVVTPTPDPELCAHLAACHSPGIGQLRKIVQILHAAGVERLVMIGKIDKAVLFRNLKYDRDALRVIWKMKDFRDESVRVVISDYFAENGISLVPQTEFLGDCLAPLGVITRKAPSKKQLADIEFGFPYAARLTDMEIGQAIVVRDRVVVAVEAIEGTDQLIMRGGELSHGKGVVIKVARSCQDQRFDVPVVGIGTLRAMQQAGLRVLAVAAGAIILAEMDKMLDYADQHGLAIIGYQNKEIASEA